MRILLALLISTAAWASNASPVNLSSVSRASAVVTVTCSATCGIPPNFGFCLAGITDGSFNVCGTAITGSGTTFTFAQSGANASSSGGTVTAAKQIIFQGNRTSAAGQVTVSYLLWNYTQTGAAQSAGSSWAGASTGENNAIKAGLFVETLRTQTFPITVNQAQIDQWAQNDWLATQNALAATFAPGQNVGCFCDPVGCGC